MKKKTKMKKHEKIDEKKRGPNGVPPETAPQK